MPVTVRSSGDGGLGEMEHCVVALPVFDPQPFATVTQSLVELQLSYVPSIGVDRRQERGVVVCFGVLGQIHLGELDRLVVELDIPQVLIVELTLAHSDFPKRLSAAHLEPVTPGQPPCVVNTVSMDTRTHVTVRVRMVYFDWRCGRNSNRLYHLIAQKNEGGRVVTRERVATSGWIQARPCLCAGSRIQSSQKLQECARNSGK